MNEVVNNIEISADFADGPSQTIITEHRYGMIARWVVVPEVWLNEPNDQRTEDAEFEIVEPKQLPQSMDIILG